MRMGPSTMPRASRGLLKWLSHMPEQVGDIRTAGYMSTCVLCMCVCVCVLQLLSGKCPPLSAQTTTLESSSTYSLSLDGTL